jgi:hypothetical protein
MRRLAGILSTALLVFSLCPAGAADQTAGAAGQSSFRYALLGKQDDGTLVVIDDGAVMRSGDLLKLNFEFPGDAWFYVCYRSSQSDYSLLYSSHAENNPDDQPVFSTLGWLALDQNPGTESFTLVASPIRLSQLEELFAHYDQATGKLRERYYKQIAKHLERLQEGESPGTGVRLTRRLDKPVMGGVVFRGATSAEITRHSLTHEASGKPLAIVTLTIQHD